jgi:ribosomal protein S18 acetylase RimI-like enzyme
MIKSLMTTIKKIELKDILALQVAEEKLFASYAWPHSCLAAHLTLQPNISYGVWQATELIAYSLATIDGENICHLQTIGVLKAYRGRGYALALHHKTITQATVAKCRQVYARIDVSNFPMFETLSNLDYKEAGHIEDYFSTGETALILKKTL